jgi:hypothetical protein
MFSRTDRIRQGASGTIHSMFTNYPVAPKQPRRVRSGERAPVRDHDAVHSVHRTPSGQRRPIGAQPDTEVERRAGAHRKPQPAYARRRP